MAGPSTPVSEPRSRIRARRVRVLTVPSGHPRRAAISDCVELLVVGELEDLALGRWDAVERGAHLFAQLLRAEVFLRFGRRLPDAEQRTVRERALNAAVVAIVIGKNRAQRRRRTVAVPARAHDRSRGCARWWRATPSSDPAAGSKSSARFQSAR